MIKNIIKQFLIENINSDNILKDIAKNISDRIYCDRFGSCVHFAELFVEEVAKTNKDLLNYFYVVEGYVITTSGKFEHTWIELKTGEKIDPTFEQFTGNIKKITTKNKYTALEYYQDESNIWFKERRKKHPEHIFKQKQF